MPDGNYTISNWKPINEMVSLVHRCHELHITQKLSNQSLHHMTVCLRVLLITVYRTICTCNIMGRNRKMSKPQAIKKKKLLRSLQSELHKLSTLWPLWMTNWPQSESDPCQTTHKTTVILMLAVHYSMRPGNPFFEFHIESL